MWCEVRTDTLVWCFVCLAHLWSLAPGSSIERSVLLSLGYLDTHAQISPPSLDSSFSLVSVCVSVICASLSTVALDMLLGKQAV